MKKEINSKIAYLNLKKNTMQLITNNNLKTTNNYLVIRSYFNIER